MTACEDMYNRIEDCVKKAKQFLDKMDWNMVVFWKNTSNEIKEKMLNMSVFELEKII